MKAIRFRDTLYYFIFSILGVCIAFRLSFPAVSVYVYPLIFCIVLFDTYFLEGTTDVYRSSRMKVLMGWLIRSAVYVLILDLIFPWHSFQSVNHLLVHFLYIFLIPVFFKFCFLSWSAHRLKKNKVTYNTIIIGHDYKAKKLASEYTPIGQHIVGSIGDSAIPGLHYLGRLESLSDNIIKKNIEEVMLALENEQSQQLNHILTILRSVHTGILIKITPDTYDFLLGHIKLDALYSAPLIELPSGQMKKWQNLLKRILDVFVSILILMLLSPLILWIIIKTKMSSKGRIIYSQVRIGKNNTPFKIYKFRSMYENAEKGLPQLSYDGDDRCTPWGTVMRKWRLDEIPQFWNVIKGDMSIVGPRPEREYFITQIKEKASFYPRILTVFPGITSWGQVKYGYASDVDQMIERLKFDLIYVENQSLSLDIKIILYTILVLFQGKGK